MNGTHGDAARQPVTCADFAAAGTRPGAYEEERNVLMKRKDFETIAAGARCCINADGRDLCEQCPYVAAAENCGHELDADLLWLADEAGQLLDWTIRAVNWLRREEPDALITMVDHVGVIPEIVSEAVFRRENDHA